jgi:hypothetical protein
MSKNPDEWGPDETGDWRRTPEERIPGIPEDHPTDIPGDIRSLPRDGKPNNRDHPGVDWNRSSDQKVPGVPEEDIPLDKPGQIPSVPQSRRNPDEEGGNKDLLDWNRNPDHPFGVGDDDYPHDKPGDIRSLPRDGKPHGEDSPDADWQRPSNLTPPGVPEEDIPFDRPGQLSAIPKSRNPDEGLGDKDLDWWCNLYFRTCSPSNIIRISWRYFNRTSSCVRCCQCVLRRAQLCHLQ